MLYGEYGGLMGGTALCESTTGCSSGYLLNTLLRPPPLGFGERLSCGHMRNKLKK